MPRRVAGGLIGGWLGLLCLATASTWSLEFPPLGEAGVSDAVCGFGVGGGRIVTVVLPGHQAGRRGWRGAAGLPLLGHDPVSRLAVLDGAGMSGSAARFSVGSSAGLAAGAVVRVEGAAGARVAGWARRFGGRVLPVSLLRLNYAGMAPAAGTPLLDGRAGWWRSATRPIRAGQRSAMRCRSRSTGGCWRILIAMAGGPHLAGRDPARRGGVAGPGPGRGGFAGGARRLVRVTCCCRWAARCGELCRGGECVLLPGSRAAGEVADPARGEGTGRRAGAAGGRAAGVEVGFRSTTGGWFGKTSGE